MYDDDEPYHYDEDYNDHDYWTLSEVAWIVLAVVVWLLAAYGFYSLVRDVLW
jgi:hypothetical protein